MICGRVVARTGSDEVYDYVACLYPEGMIDVSNLYFFNEIAIEECLHKGYESQEELDFRENVLGSLKDVEVVDGQIVPKE